MLCTYLKTTHMLIGWKNPFYKYVYVVFRNDLQTLCLLETFELSFCFTAAVGVRLARFFFFSQSARSADSPSSSIIGEWCSTGMEKLRPAGHM